jgi:dTMP kinase
VRLAYLERAASHPERIRVIEADRPMPVIREELARLLAALQA